MQVVVVAQFPTGAHGVQTVSEVVVHAALVYVPAAQIVHAEQTLFCVTTPPAWQAVVSCVEP